MAGNARLITVDDRAGEWALLLEVAQLIPHERWVLVGGLMVHAHAISGGIEPPRRTTDIDVLIDIGATTISGVAGPLQAASFEALEPSGAKAPFHRFKRGHDIVDVMVPSAANSSFRWRQRGVLRAPGAQQALNRRDHFTVAAEHSGVTVAVDVPDITGAIIAKAAAYTVDQRDRDRHLEDAVVLLAAASPRALDQNLTRRDRQHLRPLLPKLAEPDGPWRVLDEAQLDFARASLRRLVALVDGQG